MDKTGKNFIERSDKFLDYFSMIPFDINIVVYTVEEKERMVRAKNSFIQEIMERGKIDLLKRKHIHFKLLRMDN